MQPGHAISAEGTSALPAGTAGAHALESHSGGEARDSAREQDPASTPVSVPSFSAVYEEYFDFVWRSARRLGVPEASLDDVVQDVFVTVYRRLPDFEGRSQLKTWIFGILRHTISDLRRGQRRKPTSVLEQEPADARELSPQEAAVRAEGLKLLHEALASMPDDQREVFVLAELEQLSSPEIAAALDVNLNTVYSRLRSARQEFEAALKRLRSRDEWRMR
jgi:RNA polymerase sigma-70 factor (ECF subfamily)